MCRCAVSRSLHLTSTNRARSHGNPHNKCLRIMADEANHITTNAWGHPLHPSPPTTTSHHTNHNPVIQIIQGHPLHPSPPATTSHHTNHNAVIQIIQGHPPTGQCCLSTTCHQAQVLAPNLGTDMKRNTTTPSICMVQDMRACNLGRLANICHRTMRHSKLDRVAFSQWDKDCVRGRENTQPAETQMGVAVTHQWTWDKNLQGTLHPQRNVDLFTRRLAPALHKEEAPTVRSVKPGRSTRQCCTRTIVPYC